ncbi:hypothetical protein B0O80DRAFT_230578 [Mortierella sp. GBAus27b]|nr:hypothetical protein BGX31_008479 [Mortierella sp. GBA43]KAI8359396.1 hypothetical protein B0O80DRAFT_230578 [Mortierella sp. GBAus27b]
MGLKQVKFIDWFQRKFPEAVRVVFHREGARFDSVFIDVNCIVHPAILGAKTEAAFVKRLFSILDRLLSQYNPSRICYLAVDGPAPVSKIMTQKMRRSSKSKSKSTGLSRLQVTPGCPFMSRLEQYLSYYAVRYMQQRHKRDVPHTLKFVIDHSNNPGEGECKIIQNIVQQVTNIRGRPCAIISMDSDVILQSIALDMPNIYAVRKDAPDKPSLTISVDRFMRTLEGLFPGESDRVRLDFIALCLFRGNDYLRGLAVGLEKLWNAYIYTKLVDPIIQQRGALRFLIDADFKTFDLLFLKQLLLNSYKNPSDLILPLNLQPQPSQQESNPTSALVDDELDELVDKMELMDADDHNENNDVEDDTDDEINDDTEDLNLDQDSGNDADLTSSVGEFLTGVLWNLEMYCSGKCPDVSFRYLHPSSPPRRAIIKFVESVANMKRHQALHPKTTSTSVNVARSDKDYLHPLVCGLILLPPDKSGEYLPQSVASIHTQLVPSESKNLTFEEMETVDTKVRMLIDILRSSGKGNDVTIAKELAALYETRPAYIWARHSPMYIHPGMRPITLPVSPRVILDQLNNASNATPGSGPSFPDLLEESDIRCNIAKNPPTQQVSQGHGDNGPGAATDFVAWTQNVRQESLTVLGGVPGLPWPFRLNRSKLHTPAQRSKQPSPQPADTPSQPQQPQQPSQSSQKKRPPQKQQRKQHPKQQTTGTSSGQGPSRTTQ